MTVNVFVCHTPFHNFLCGRLCNEQLKSADNVIISSVPALLAGSGHKVVGMYKGLVGRIFSLMRAKGLLVWLALRHKDNLQILLPHVEGVLGNYVYHAWLLRVLGAQVSFYYDGLLMLDNYRATRTFPRYNVERIFLSAFILHWYRLHKDILPVYSSRIARVFTPIVELTPGPGDKLIQIQVRLEEFSSSSGTCVVLGTDVGSDAIRIANRMLISYLLEHPGINNVLFKPHYAAATNSFEDEAGKAGLKYSVVKDVRCIEEMVTVLKPSILVAPYLSSALINVKLLCRDAVDVVCIAHKETLHYSGKENMDTASGYGVRIVPVEG